MTSIPELQPTWLRSLLLLKACSHIFRGNLARKQRKIIVDYAYFYSISSLLEKFRNRYVTLKTTLPPTFLGRRCAAADTMKSAQSSSHASCVATRISEHTVSRRGTG